MRKRLLLLAVIALLGAQSASTQSRVRGIMGQKAPAWSVETWFNLPEGVERIDVADFEGKVVYLFGFQSWCPGCHRHGFPTLKKVIASSTSQCNTFVNATPSLKRSAGETNPNVFRGRWFS